MRKLITNRYVWITVLLVVLAIGIGNWMSKPEGCRLDRKDALIHVGMTKTQTFELMADVTIAVYQHDESYLEGGRLGVQSEFIWDDGIHNFKIVVNPDGIIQSKCLGESAQQSRVAQMVEKLGF